MARYKVVKPADKDGNGEELELVSEDLSSTPIPSMEDIDTQAGVTGAEDEGSDQEDKENT